MPLYDFQCPKCGLQFEVSRSRDKAGEPAQCPQDGTEAQRVWAPVPSIVKGGTIATTPPPPAAGADHGHSHGPGGHTH